VEKENLNNNITDYICIHISYVRQINI